MSTPDVDDLVEITRVLGEWQFEGATVQLHPGDLGWFWRFGADATAAAVRTWDRDGRILAVGMLDGPDTLRVAIAPDTQRDDELARTLATDVADPDRGVLPAGRVAVESWAGPLVQDALEQRGWQPDEPWTPLRRDLTDPVVPPDVRIEIVGPEGMSASTAVHRSAFNSTRLTDERWQAMLSGEPAAGSSCLLAYDDDNTAVAAITVWSAGPGKPGLIEPMGVHADHRGHGYGRAVCIAAAATLQDMGSSSAVVATPSSNVGGLATYESAGFRRLPELRDRYRP